MSTSTKRAGIAPANCSRCGKPDDPRAMIEASRENAIDPDYVCLSCWWKRGASPVSPAAEPPKPVHEWAHRACSSYKTADEASARAVKVEYHLGVRPEISPSDASASGPFFVIGDSPLVPGFKGVKNPYA